MKTLLGIDYGTGGCKVTALGTDGSLVGEASVEYTTYHDHPGWSEQEPQDWWDALCAALRKLAGNLLQRKHAGRNGLIHVFGAAQLGKQQLFPVGKGGNGVHFVLRFV